MLQLKFIIYMVVLLNSVISYTVKVRVFNNITGVLLDFVTLPLFLTNGSQMSAWTVLNMSKIPFEYVTVPSGEKFVYSINHIPCSYNSPIHCWVPSVNNGSLGFGITHLFLNNEDELNWDFSILS